ncbi:MAPEG family protein [Albimonas sp. CAU 1670]|uniref:MAPEG family protein n=1 Tax=Albimonas sp. CAU 1670 TaxID=3032599 RepID=UPI0023D9A890|nr:MAPEG family protein [Albimonas sp. CAU 1670]MDF2232593.1 MAPEG family protein [Albimonas sp. CAU 1670]
MRAAARTRARVLAGMGAGAALALGTLAAGAGWGAVPGDGSPGARLALAATALLGPGAALAAVIGRIAQRRFFDAALIEGQAPAPGSGAEIDQRVLRNTVEQALLAALAWPALALALPADRLGAVAALGLAFPVSRAMFWIGYHRAPLLRAPGFAWGFYASVMAIAWAGWLAIA